MKKNTERIERNVSIDRFRGIIIFLMILFQALEYFPSLGVLSEVAVHSPDTFPKTVERIAEGFGGVFILPNMTLADLIASAFMFTIGLTLIKSYNNRTKKYGKKVADRMMMERYLLILGVGMTMTGFENFVDFGPEDWMDVTVLVLSAIVMLSGVIWFFTSKVFKCKEKVVKIFKNITRFSTLAIGIFGLLLSTANFIIYVCGIERNLGLWDVFQHIGLAGFMAVLIMSFSKTNSTKYRTIAGFVAFAIFAIFHETTLPTLAGNTEITNNMLIAGRTVDGGFIGAFGYASIVLLSTVISDIYSKDPKKFRIITLLLAIPVAAVVIYVFKTFEPWDPNSTTLLTGGITKHLNINKDSISPAYLLITFFTSSVMFMIVDLFKNVDVKTRLFEMWGRNPLLLFILQFIFVNILLEFVLNDFAANASLGVSIICGTALMALITFISYLLYKNDKVIKI